MATLKPIAVIQTPLRLKRSVYYVMQKYKTMDGKLVSGVNLVPQTSEDVLSSFERTKVFFHKTNGKRLAYHWEQSFAPGEVSPETAHMIGVEFAKKILPDFEILVTTHVDKKHIHNHFIFNSVSLVTGLKYHQPKELLFEYGRVNDEICKKYGLSVVQAGERKQKRRTMSYAETNPQKANKPIVRNFIYEDFDAAISQATSLDDFFSILEHVMGYRVKRGVNVAHTAVAPKGHNFFRMYKFRKGYTEEDIAQRIKESHRETNVESKWAINTPSAFRTGAVTRSVKNISYFLYPSAPVSLLNYSAYLLCRYHRRGLCAVFLQYRHILKKLDLGTYPKYPSFELRRDLQQMETFNKETVLLATNKIDTDKQLADYNETLDQHVSEIYREIRRLKGRLRSSRKEPLDAAEREEMEKQIIILKDQVRPLVEKQRLCKDIAQRSQQYSNFLDSETEWAIEQQEDLQNRPKEKQTDIDSKGDLI